MKRSPKNLQKYRAFIKEVWDERPHVCEDCGEPIGEWDCETGELVPHYHNIAHIGRRRTEEDCLNKDNIKLKCFKCHSQNDHKLKINNSQWLK